MIKAAKTNLVNPVKTNPVNPANTVRGQSSQPSQCCQYCPNPNATAAGGGFVFATPPDGGGFFDSVDSVDSIDCVDGGQD